MPTFIDVFLEVVRDNQTAQVACVATLLLILLDIVFGLLNALIHREYSSAVMREGLGHKSAEFGFLLIGIVVDGAIIGGFDFGYSAPVFTVMCAYVCVMEIGSLLETFSRLNPDAAEWKIFKLLKQNKALLEEAQDDESE